MFVVLGATAFNDFMSDTFEVDMEEKFSSFPGGCIAWEALIFLVIITLPALFNTELYDKFLEITGTGQFVPIILYLLYVIFIYQGG